MGTHVTLHGKNNIPFNGNSGSWEPVRVGAGGQLAVSMSTTYVNLTGSGVVSSIPCVIYGYIITVAMSGAVTHLHDNATTGAGTILFQIRASEPIGVYIFPIGIRTVNGAYADFAGTGTVNFLIAPAA